MDDIINYLPLVMKGTGVTILVSVSSLILAVFFGLLGSWGKLSASRAANRTAGAYTTLIRGVPDLVLMLLIFYGGQQLLNDLGSATGLWEFIEINHFTAGVFTIGFILGAYMTETFRGAYLAIPSGQIEAGVACGMSRRLLMVRIVWPQLVRYALPSFSNNWLVLLKTTALVSVIGLHDLVYQAMSAGRSTRQLFSFLFLALGLYLLLTTFSNIGIRWLDRKYSVGIRRV